MHRRVVLWAACCVVGLVAVAHAEITMKVMVVNPSESEAKEVPIRAPLPPEVKPEHVLDADGLSVEYDSQAGTYVLVGTVVLKPKESITRKVVLADAWVVPAERVAALRQETGDIARKLSGSGYEDQGRVLIGAIDQRLQEIAGSQEQALANPQQHISRYRENMKKLQFVEADMVSLRQLMVMASLNPPQPPLLSGGAAGTSGRGQLSVLATWRLIFIILGFLGCVSLSFFLIWQRQLKAQLRKQAAREQAHDRSGEAVADGRNLPPLPAPPPEPKRS